MTNFSTIIKAVEENNNLNSGKWENWDDGNHIISTYAEDGYSDDEICEDTACSMLDILIENNGDWKAIVNVMEDGEFLKNNGVTQDEAEALHYFANNYLDAKE